MQYDTKKTKKKTGRKTQNDSSVFANFFGQILAQKIVFWRGCASVCERVRYLSVCSTASLCASGRLTAAVSTDNASRFSNVACCDTLIFSFS